MHYANGRSFTTVNSLLSNVYIGMNRDESLFFYKIASKDNSIET